MNLGKMMSFASPLYGMASGQGIGKVMPFLSPAYGLMADKGPFQADHLKHLLGPMAMRKGGMFGAGMGGGGFMMPFMGGMG